MDKLTNNLYNIMYTKNTEVGIRLTDASHPVFKAHFPNYPVLPAFLQIDIISEIFNLDIIGIIKSKFIEPLFPLDELVIYREEQNKNIKIKFKKKDKITSEIIVDIR
ncbi:MAG: hypothetical protein PHI79_05690 [Sulfurovaceae bacterium]|nr:hypothetical protein [Sulfurovaceae bacterium]MDD5549069.1 hypothetical protein [Sulfurovaceae bacterium]